eukprot:UN03889
MGCIRAQIFKVVRRFQACLFQQKMSLHTKIVASFANEKSCATDD